MAALTEFEEAAVMRTVDTCYTGIQARLYTPTRYGVGEVTEETKYNYYFNFYLGFDDELEAGISHTRKYAAQLAATWRKFSYSFKDHSNNFPLGLPAGMCTLKLIVDQDRFTHFYLDGVLVATIRIPKPYGAAKMCFAVCDTNKADKHQVWFDNAAFELTGIRTMEGQKRPGDPKGWLGLEQCDKLNWERRYRPPTARLPRMMTNWGLTPFRTVILEPVKLK